MTKLGSTASQESPATPKHRIIICSYIDQTQWGSKLKIQIMVKAEYKKNSAAKRFITTCQLSDLLRPNFGEKFWGKNYVTNSFNDFPEWRVIYLDHIESFRMHWLWTSADMCGFHVTEVLLGRFNLFIFSLLPIEKYQLLQVHCSAVSDCKLRFKLLTPQGALVTCSRRLLQGGQAFWVGSNLSNLLRCCLHLFIFYPTSSISERVF